VGEPVKGYGRQHHCECPGPIPEGFYRHPAAIRTQIKLAHDVGAAYPPGILLPHETRALAEALEFELVEQSTLKLKASRENWAKSTGKVKARGRLLPGATPAIEEAAALATGKALSTKNAAAMIRLSEQFGECELDDGHVIFGKLRIREITRLMEAGVEVELLPDGRVKVPVEVGVA
jgi:hypothetical protein